MKDVRDKIATILNDPHLQLTTFAWDTILRRVSTIVEEEVSSSWPPGSSA